VTTPPGLSTHPASMCARTSEQANERGLDSPNLFVTTFTQNRGMIVCSKLVAGQDNLSKAKAWTDTTSLSLKLSWGSSEHVYLTPTMQDGWMDRWMDGWYVENLFSPPNMAKNKCFSGFLIAKFQPIFFKFFSIEF
jgi:hypothetical protein